MDDINETGELPALENAPAGSEYAPQNNGELEGSPGPAALKGDAVNEAISIPGSQGQPGRVSQVHISLDLPEGARVRVTVESLPAGDEAAGSPARLVFESQESAAGVFRLVEGPEHLQSAVGAVSRPGAWMRRSPLVGASARLRTALLSWPYSLELTLFGCALVFYLATHLIGLTRFPIYFFTDEAVQTVSAADLIRDHLRDEEGTFLPTYFKNGPFYNLSLSVYLQVLPYLLFGKSVFVTRLVSVLVSLLAAGAVGLALRDIFKIPYWWSGVLLLAIAPAWFLHSRTAFETVIFVSFYACFLYAYLLYRYRSPRYLNAAVLFGALAFYSYSPGQIVILGSALLLLFSDLRYHWQNRPAVLRGLGLLLLLALPYIRFRLGHLEAPFDHLRKLGSYWVQPLPLNEKISQYISEYLYGLSPGYWYLPNERDLPRHLMRGYGHLLRWTLPFAALGFALALKNIRSSSHRLLIIALLVAPAGSALVQIGITRALVFVVPATLLTVLGLSKTLSWLEARRLPRQAISVGLFALLILVGFAMSRDALVNGPFWYRDYGLGGLQYGARQLFPMIAEYLEEFPDTRIIVSPDWANGTDEVARFFLPDPIPIQMGSIDGHLFERLPLDDNTLFVMIPDEYQKTIDSGKFTDVRVEQSLPYPDGRPGFYFVRLRYAENIDEILASEREERRALQTAEIDLDGQRVQVRYPLLDIGGIGDMFDRNPDTLGRTLEANPATLELVFPEPRRISGLSLIVGSAEVQVTARLYATPGDTPVEYIQVLKGDIEQPEVSLTFDPAASVKILHLEVWDIHQPEPGHIHIWEIELH